MKQAHRVSRVEMLPLVKQCNYYFYKLTIVVGIYGSTPPKRAFAWHACGHRSFAPTQFPSSFLFVMPLAPAPAPALAPAPASGASVVSTIAAIAMACHYITPQVQNVLIMAHTRRRQRKRGGGRRSGRSCPCWRYVFGLVVRNGGAPLGFSRGSLSGRQKWNAARIATCFACTVETSEERIEESRARNSWGR